MSNLDDICYEGVKIQLKGKTRKLLYTAKGMKILAREFGTVYKALNCMRTLNYEMDEETIDKLSLLLYAGLIHEDENLTLEQVGDFLSFDKMVYLAEKISDAISGSLPQANQGNAQTQPEK